MAEQRAGGLSFVAGGRRPTVGALLHAIEAELASRDESPRAASHELLAALMDVPRHWTHLHASDETDERVWDRALAAARKRASGAPLAYAVGRASFRGFTLAVDERVLIPRPETELLVELVLKRRSTGAAMDVGTGSGAIAIALAKEGQFERVVGTDISMDALEVARANAASAAARVEFEAANQQPSAGVPGEAFDVVVSNPPYIAYSEANELPADVRDWEPAIALFSGRNGMSATAGIVAQAGASLRANGLLALEVDVRRASLVVELVASDGRYENVSIELDLTGRERFVLATRRGDG